MFNLSGRGLNFCGMDSHVFLPIITALRVFGFVVLVVTSLKYLISLRSLQGILPLYPIPKAGFNAATMIATFGFSIVVYS